MYAIVLGLPEEKDQPPRYQRVPLDIRYADSPDMKKLMADYQEQLKQLGFDGLGIREKLHPRQGGRRFVWPVHRFGQVRRVP